jgi:SAM-dependent methyltransferase
MSQSLVTCAACHGINLHGFYRVEAIPVHSCLMLDTRETALAFPRRDLELGFCADCGFVQNLLFDPTVQHYSIDYEETQSFSPRFQRFVEEICDDQERKYHLGGKTALEIGCGKGEFLVALCERTGCAGIGIDPGYRPERTHSSVASRLTFIQDFYGPKYRHLKADYVCCRHTLEHIHDVLGFMRLVREAIGDRPDVPVFFELPDLERVLRERAFWDIYYEHCSYFTLGSLARLFRRTGFKVTDLWKAYDGQYLMIEARPILSFSATPLPEEDDLARIREEVSAFAADIRTKFAGLRAQAAGWSQDGKKVALWGSGSKAVSYLTTLGLRDEVAAVVDINPHKHGKFLAGSGHEIVAPEALVALRPDVVVVMNAIYVAEIGASLRGLGLAPEIVALA